MENLEVKTAEFETEPEMRCAGMCRGSCSCPTGHCRCRISEVYSSRGKEFEDSDSYLFRQAA
ncbi:MAG: hypothetical protein WC494_03565 [Candidatus Pacearchaeota archaeon]